MCRKVREKGEHLRQGATVTDALSDRLAAHWPEIVVVKADACQGAPERPTVNEHLGALWSQVIVTEIHLRRVRTVYQSLCVGLGT